MQRTIAKNVCPLVVFAVLTGGCGGGGGGAISPTASVRGDVRAVSGSQPLAGVSVTVGGKTDTTDSQGEYVITRVPTGDQPLSVSKPGYEVLGSLPPTVPVSGPNTLLNTIYMIASDNIPPLAP